MLHKAVISHVIDIFTGNGWKYGGKWGNIGHGSGALSVQCIGWLLYHILYTISDGYAPLPAQNHQSGE